MEDQLYQITPAYIAIDPGKNGGVVAMTKQGDLAFKSIIPLMGDDVDIHGLYDLFKTLRTRFDITLILEDVHSVFGASAGANFTFGFVCGAIEAIVISHKFKLIKVQPKEWQKEVWQQGDKSYKTKKPEQKNPSLDTKLTSLKCATRLFPHYDFRKSESKRVTNPHDGIVDAALICEWARRKNL